jgi:transcriptional regulator with XRE-family HTH domain
METLGQRLKRFRQATGLSQAKLAAAAGVPLGTLRNIEYDHRRPLFEAMVKIAGALGVSLDELAGQEAAKSPPATAAKAKRKRGK